MKPRFAIILSTVVLAGTTTWILINRGKKQKQLKQLMDDLATGNKSEDPTDVGVLTKTGGPLDPTMWRSAKAGTPLFTTAVAQTEVVKIYNMIHGTANTSDESGLIKYFSALKSKAQASELAEFYQKKYGIALAEDLKSIDYTFLGLRWGSPDLPKIQQAILTLP